MRLSDLWKKAFGARKYEHDVDGLKAIWEKYRGQIGLRADASYSPDAFDNVAKERFKDIKGFSAIEKPTDAALYEALSEDTEEVHEVNEAIKKALEFDDDNDAEEERNGFGFKKAQKDYSLAVLHFKELVKLIPQTFSAADLVDTMKKFIDDGRKAIETQQKHDTEALTTLFDSEEFQGKLTAANLDPVSTKSSMLKDLKASQITQLKAFDNSIAKSQTELSGASAKEKAKINMLGHLFERNPKMREKIIAAAAERDAKAGITRPTSIGVGEDDNLSVISGIEIKDLGDIITKTGAVIVANPDGKTFNIQLNSAMWGFLSSIPSWYDITKDVKEDVILLALAIKAAGFEAITMTVDFPDNPERAIKMAKIAYEGAIEAGFDPKNIKVMVNGVEKSPSEIFRDNPSALQAAQKKSSTIQQKFAAMEVGGPGNTALVKEELKKIIARSEAPAEGLNADAEEDLDNAEDIDNEDEAGNDLGIPGQ